MKNKYFDALISVHISEESQSSFHCSDSNLDCKLLAFILHLRKFVLSIR